MRCPSDHMTDIPDGAPRRPMALIIDKPTPCCDALLLIEVDGTYRCPCGKRQERLAKSTILSHLLDASGNRAGQSEDEA